MTILVTIACVSTNPEMKYTVLERNSFYCHFYKKPVNKFTFHTGRRSKKG